MPRVAFALGEPSHVSTAPSPASFALAADHHSAPLYIDSADWPGVLHAAQNFANDVQQVTGDVPAIIHDLSSRPADIVLIGTLGHSPTIDRLVAAHKIDVSNIRGHWEMSVTTIVDRPLPGVRRALVIAGADKRGTIYGIYDLSEQIGVSPWAWWADVPVSHKDALYVTAGTYIQPEPAVKYRGIFFNDEAPSLTNWVHEKYGNYNSKFYTRVFDLLLRLKANFLWPAMWNNAFAVDDPLNPKLADEYGIVMSTSHEEPMMRAEKEWHAATDGPWDYSVNAKHIDDFWRAGLIRNKDYEQIITLGMRGPNDTPMANGSDLEKVVADQRRIISETINPDVAKVPQVWCLYKEVQGYYDKGMRVPDDVTLLWSDDNWGNIRRLPTPEERKRPGGAGIYYHFDYHGGPRSYQWVNSTYLPQVAEQMHLALDYGADRIWVVNVGDGKPLEFPIEFFLAMAREPKRWRNDNTQEFTELWAAREFGPEHAKEIARVMEEYTRYNARRKPELIDTTSFSNPIEADRILAEYKDTVARAKAIEEQLAPQYRNAYFELVLYPAEASENVLEMNILAAKNKAYAAQGRVSTNDLAAQVRADFAKDAEFTREYHTLLDGKWDHMMDQVHLGYTTWSEPPANIMPAVEEVQPLREGKMGTQVVAPPLPPGGFGFGGAGAARAGAAPRAAGAGAGAGAPGRAAGRAAAPAAPAGGFRGFGFGPALAFDAFTRAPQTVELYNIGATPFTYTATASAPWIRLSSSGGEVAKDANLGVSIDWASLPAGDQTGSVTVTQQGFDPKGNTARTFRVTVSNPGSLAAVHGFVESGGVVSMNANHFTAKTASAAAQWVLLPGYGETDSAMTISPSLAPSESGSSTCLNYDIYTFGSGAETLESFLSPTMAFVPGRGLRYSVALDSAAPAVVDAWADNSQAAWGKAVSDGVHRISTSLTVDRPGQHTLHFCMVDPGVVVEKLVLSRGRQPFWYLGAPESLQQR
ncbi:MAG TPA: glycosyl hydrolase 115 family protein [Acidobacteriaceae bacterium]|nr:glycosyl hydrolase 115 family protein [Acidobacteriaceae bacterium]